MSQETVKEKADSELFMVKEREIVKRRKKAREKRK